jgi:cell division protein FtsL
MSAKLGLIGLLIALVAASGLYVMKDRVNRLEGELRRHRALVAAEETKLHRLRAEWAMLEQPGRLARLAAEHLQLQPARPTQIMAIADLPERAELGLDQRVLRVVLPSGAEVDLRLKPQRPTSPLAAMAKALRREP